MKRLLIVAMVFSCGAGAVFAADDVIAQRQALMKTNGKASQTVGGMIKGSTPFDLAAAQAALKVFIDCGKNAPALFPDTSKTGGDTEALPAIWDNKKDFDARFAKFGTDATDALASVTDKASFGAAMTPVFKNCGGCHEKYRAKSD